MDPKITLEQIRTVVEEVVEQKLEEKLEQKLEEKLNKRLKPIEDTLKKIRKDLKDTFVFADNNYLRHEDRIRHIEDKLQIPRPF